MDTKEEMWNFCKNVKWLRERNRLSQEEMAVIMGIAPSALRMIEAGRIPQQLSANVIIILAARFSIKSHELFSPLDV